MATNIVEDVKESGRYTDAEDVVSARSRKGHQWFFTGRTDAEAQLAGRGGFILAETLWLMRVRYRWPESAVEEYMRGYGSVIHE